VLQACRVFAKKDPDLALMPIKLLRSKAADKPCWDVDARFIVPVIGSLGKDEALANLTKVAKVLGPDDVRAAIANVVNGSVGRSIEALELVLTLINLDSSTDHKALMTATDALMEQQSLINERVLRRVFEEVVEQPVLPLIIMRVVLKAYSTFKAALKPDVLVLLEKLAMREVWTNPDIWQGYAKCIYMVRPDSFPLMLRLPDDQIFDILQRYPDIKPHLKNAAKNDLELMGAPSKEITEADMEVEEEAEEAEGAGQVKQRPLSARVRQLLDLN